MNVFKWFKNLFNPIDLTRGSILKNIIIFLIPILLSLIFQQLYSLTDAIIVGQTLSSPEISGINDVGPLCNIALQFAIGCTSGFSVIIANLIGKKDKDGARKSFIVQIILSLIITIILTIAFCLSTDSLLSLMDIKSSEIDVNKQMVYEAAHDYLFVIYLGIICQMGYNLIVANLRALGDSFTPFLFLVFGTIANIFLDLLFIIPLKLGVAGSAWATNLSQLLAAIGCFIYAFIKYPFLKPKKEDFKFNYKFIVAHLKDGCPLGFNFAILQIGIVIMQMAVISFDYDPNGNMLATQPAQIGYSIACKIIMILVNAYNALGTCAITYFGQNDGAKNYERINKGFKTLFIIGIIMWIGLGGIFLLMTINGAYLYIFLDKSKINADVIKFGNDYLYVTLPLSIIVMILILLRNTLSGLNKPLTPFLAGIGELLARSLLCLFLPEIVNGGPINSLANEASYITTCFADPLAWIAASLIMIVPMILVIKNNNKLIAQNKIVVGNSPTTINN